MDAVGTRAIRDRPHDGLLLGAGNPAAGGPPAGMHDQGSILVPDRPFDAIG